MVDDARGPLRLLAVEDDSTDRSWLDLMLKNATVCDHRVRYVITMADAESALAGGEFDCVLLDLSLPDCDGIDSVRRALGADPSVAIVVFTGRKDQEIGLRAIEAGAQDYLIKGEASGNQILQAAQWATARLSARAGQAVSLTDRLGAPWVVLAGDGHIAEVNDEFLKLLGYIETEVVGSSFGTLLDAERGPEIAAALRSITTGRTTTFLLGGHLRHRQGNAIPCTIIGASLAGEPRGALVLLATNAES